MNGFFKWADAHNFINAIPNVFNGDFTFSKLVYREICLENCPPYCQTEIYANSLWSIWMTFLTSHAMTFLPILVKYFDVVIQILKFLDMAL